MDYYLTSSLSQEEVDSIYAKEEYWVPIKGYEGRYEISSKGRVKSLARVTYRPQGNLTVPERILKLRVMSSGYMSVGLFDTKHHGSTVKLIHRLYAEAFVPNPLNLPCVNHKDGNKLNNDLSNLEWCSYAVNNKHATDTKLKAVRHGEDVTSSKLTNREAHEIRSMYTYENMSTSDLADEFGLSKEAIRQIIRGNTYKDDDETLIVESINKLKNAVGAQNKSVPRNKVIEIRNYISQNPLVNMEQVMNLFGISQNQYYKIKSHPRYGLPPKRRSFWLSKDIVMKIRSMLENGVTYSSIAKSLNVSVRQIEKISRGQTYKHMR